MEWCVIIKASVGEVTMMNYKIYKNVNMGKNVEVGDFVVIGLPLSGGKEGEQETIIEDGAVIGAHSVVYAGARLGRNFKCGHGVVIGEDSAVGSVTKTTNRETAMRRYIAYIDTSYSMKRDEPWRTSPKVGRPAFD